MSDKNSSKSKNTYNIKINTVSNETETKQDTEFKDTIEIREKRIGIVFKVIYVFAIAFGTVFMDFNKRYESGIDAVYIAEICLMSFLLIMIGYFISYIINEMKCLRINMTDISNNQFIATEESFTRIFTCLRISGITSLLLFCILNYTYNFLPFNFMKVLSFISAFLSGSFMGLLLCVKNNKAIRIISDVFCFFMTFSIICFFFVLAKTIPTIAS